MNILELFAGSRSFGKIAESLGHNVCSVDIFPFDKIDIVCDIEFLSLVDLPFIPDLIWASPLCTSYTISAISHHRNGIEPKSELASKSDRVILNTLKLIGDCGCIFFIENPRGMLRKMPFMQGIDRTTVTYCSYGDIRMKPTDIFSNHINSLFHNGWVPKKMCFNSNLNCHHEFAPRGSKTGTQGLKNSYDRSKIPEKLCLDILESVEFYFFNNLEIGA